jgi:hypothetical protein
MGEAQAYLDRWEERRADTRIHGTTKRQVAAAFAEERPALLHLPLEPFRYYQFGQRTVHLDGCVEVKAASYGAPPGWIGRRAQVQWDGRHVSLLDPNTGQLLRECLRQQRGGHRIKDEDRPSKTPLGMEQLLARSGSKCATEGAKTDCSELLLLGLGYLKLRLSERVRCVGLRLDNPRAIKASAAGSPGVLLEHPPRAAFAYRDFVESPRARMFADRCRSIKVANTTDGNRGSIR